MIVSGIGRNRQSSSTELQMRVVERDSGQNFEY